MLTVTLFSKPGCHLCEDVVAELRALAHRYPHQLTEIDIEGDRQLFARYHLTIPVVRIGEVELQAPISATELESALLRALAGGGAGSRAAS